jgi:hypothetical protein
LARYLLLTSAVTVLGACGGTTATVSVKGAPVLPTEPPHPVANRDQVELIDAVQYVCAPLIASPGVRAVVVTCDG